MDQLPLFQEDSPVNPSPQREREKEQMMTDTSGMKLLELLPSVNRGGLLEKMLTDLLTSKTAWYSDRCKMIWKKRVSKSNVLLFQLAVSVHGIKGKESGLLPSPNTMDYIDRKGMRPSRVATNRKSGYLSEMIKMYPTPRALEIDEKTETWRARMKKIVQKGGKLPSVNLSMTVKMYPTPTAGNCMDVCQPADYVERNSKGWTVTRKKTGTKFGAKLNDVVNKLQTEGMYPTPNARDWKDTVNTIPPSVGKTRGYTLGMKIAEEKTNNKAGGKLNPNFVEFLMGYPTNYTKVE